MSKQVETLKKELNEMYQTAFENCRKCNYKKCSARKLSYKQKIKYDYAVHIGEKYDEGKYKVLCVGKEGTDDHKTVENTISISDPQIRHDNVHYLGTIYTLALLEGENPQSTKYSDLEKYKDIHKQFCLTNYFKCAFTEENEKEDKVRGLSVNSSMKSECFKILLKEIEILKPNLVIIQGKFTTDPFWKALEKEHKAKILYKNAESNPDISLYKYTLKSRAFCVLWSYHPASPKWHKTLPQFKEALEMFKTEFAKSEHGAEF